MSSSDPDGLELLAEVQDLVDDVGAWLAWTRLGGAEVVPADGPLERGDRQELVQALSAGLRKSGASGPGGRARPSPPPRPTGRFSAPGTSPRSRPPEPPAEAPPSFNKPPPAPTRPPPQQQGSLGRWGRFLDSGQPKAPTVGALDAASTLEQVRAELGECRRCGLCRGRRNIVFGVGAEQTPLMVIGEGPGANEDRRGEPFVGKAGQMLDRMLENVLGLPRSKVYITNVVKCRPPDNRNPTADEIARCRPFLLSQLRVVKPKVVLVLGSVACRAVFETHSGVTRLRGEWRTLRFPGGEAKAMPTFHPAYLLRQPDEKRKTFADLKAVKAALQELA